MEVNATFVKSTDPGDFEIEGDASSLGIRPRAADPGKVTAICPKWETTKKILSPECFHKPFHIFLLSSDILD
jgi:hypothetical protein